MAQFKRNDCLFFIDEITGQPMVLLHYGDDDYKEQKPGTFRLIDRLADLIDEESYCHAEILPYVKEAIARWRVYVDVK